MPNYSYKAIDNTGKLFRGKVIALGEKDAEIRIAHEGLTLIQSKVLKESRLEKLFSNAKIKPRLLIELYRRLSQTLEMGLSIVDALDENSKQLPSRTLRKTLSEIRVTIEGGKTLHESISRFPKVFSKLDRGIIMMGEQTGVLPQCLKDLADFHEWRQDINSAIKKATIYPAFVLVALGAVCGVWIGYVLPLMAVLFKEMGVSLPGVTRIVLIISTFIRDHWLWLVGGCVLMLVVLLLMLKSRRGNLFLQKHLLRVPLIGEVAQNIALARLCHYFATMYTAGMSITTIFEILANSVLGNKYLESRVTAAFEATQLGHSIAESFEMVGAFPLLLVGGIKNGEISGTLDETFKRMGTFYDGEVKRTVQAMVSAIEPITIIMLGGLFGLIILSILLPLYDVFGQMGKAY
jgi:type IV pilus assembly protein PilC